MKRVAVFGLGRFGSSVAVTLAQAGVEVLAVDKNRNLVEQVKNDVTEAVSFDATDRDNLESQSVGDMDAVVVGIGDNFEAAVIVTLLCKKELGVERVIAKALNARQRRVLELLGAEVVQPEEQMGRWLAENLVHDSSVVNFVELPEGFSLLRIRTPAGWEGKTLGELRLLSQQRLNLIQVVRPRPDAEEPEKVALPSGQFRLQAGDQLDVIGPVDVLRGFVPVRTQAEAETD